jgi:hypothetical protein
LSNKLFQRNPVLPADKQEKPSPKSQPLGIARRRDKLGTTPSFHVERQWRRNAETEFEAEKAVSALQVEKVCAGSLDGR